jgi:hypothetical protein
MNHPTIQKDSPAWLFFVWASFVSAVSIMGLGILYAPVDLWVKAFFAMGLLFTVGSSITLSKTLRDNFEAERMVNRVVDAKTEKILHDYELRKA